jgi:hypothetical protein
MLCVMLAASLAVPACAKTGDHENTATAKSRASKHWKDWGGKGGRGRNKDSWEEIKKMVHEEYTKGQPHTAHAGSGENDHELQKEITLKLIVTTYKDPTDHAVHCINESLSTIQVGQGAPRPIGTTDNCL